MTTNYHTPISTGATINAATVNIPLGQLDEAITDLTAATLAALYSKTANQTISNNTLTVVDFDNKEYDPQSVVTTGASWLFTVPSGQAGLYLVGAHVAMAGSTGWVAAEVLSLDILKNGSGVYYLDYIEHVDTATNVQLWLNGSTVVNLAETDTFAFRVLQNSGAGLNIDNQAERSYCYIIKIGN